MPNLHLVERQHRSRLESLVDDYLNHCRAAGLSVATMKGSYELALLRVFLPWCQGRSIDDLDSLDARAFDAFSVSLLQRRTPHGKPVSKETVRTYTRPIRQFLSWADRNGEVVRAKPQLPRTGKRRRAVLTRDEIDYLESLAPRERDKLIIRLLADCGLRLAEVANLRTRDIVRSSHRGYLDVRGKGDRERRVPIPPKLMLRVTRYVSGLPHDAGTDRIFLALRRNAYREWTELSKDAVANVVELVAARSELGKRVHAHLFRHSWMTEMLRRGMNPIQLSLIAGASQEVIAEHYQHLDEVDAYDAMIRAISHDN